MASNDRTGVGAKAVIRPQSGAGGSMEYKSLLLTSELDHLLETAD
jgi:hypothetical protein